MLAQIRSWFWTERGIKPVVVCLIFLFRIPMPSSGQSVPFPVALSGTAAPAGGNYSSFGIYPVLNSSGQVVFAANLTGGSSTNGLFIGTPGALQAVALQGTAAPAGGNYNGPGIPVLNSSGQIAFVSNLTGGSSTVGIFAGTPGSIQTVARQGIAAPAGGNYSNFGSPTLSASGQVAFTASLTGGTSTSGIFTGTAGSVQSAALQGTAAPAGGNYSNFPNNTVINPSGTIAFTAALTGGSSTSGIFSGTPGSLQTVALRGSAAPAGGNYDTLNQPVINASGRVAFVANLTGGSSFDGLYSGMPGSLQTIARSGTLAPSGGTYAGFDYQRTVLNSAGQVAFYSSLSGGTSAFGIFMGTPGSVQTVALSGAAAPGGATFDDFGSPVVNASGRLAFIGVLSGPGVTTANDWGLYAGLPGNFVKIVREGDVIDIDPGPGVVNRTVGAIGFDIFPGSGGEDGLGLTFNDAGQIVYRLTFTDNSSGIFISQIAVPEPTTIVLLWGTGFLGITGFWHYRRKRLSLFDTPLRMSDR